MTFKAAKEYLKSKQSRQNQIMECVCIRCSCFDQKSDYCIARYFEIIDTIFRKACEEMLLNKFMRDTVEEEKK